MHADLIFTGGPVRDHRGLPPAGALAVKGDRILAVGETADIMHLAGPRTRVVDLAGRCLLPALTDSHLHIHSYGMGLRRLQLADVAAPEQIGRLVAERAASLPTGAWIRGRGWNQEAWPGAAMPTAGALDAVAPAHPVLLHRACGHIAVANSVALQLAGVGPGTPDPPGGAIDRDAEGRPTGILRETAIDLVARQIPPATAAERAEGLAAALRECLALGITQVHTDDVTTAGGVDGLIDLYTRVAGPESIPVRATLLMRAEHLTEARARGFATGAPLTPGGDPRWLRWGMVKIFADGSLGGRTAALRAPYSDDPTTSGIYIHEREEMMALVSEVHRLGLQLGVHVIGDGAAELLLDAIAAAQAAHPRAGARHRLIHCQITGADQLERFRALGVIADIQPVFLRTDGHFYAARVGAERARTSYAWGTMLRLGIPACGGSDAPVEPLNPFYGIHCAVTRQDLNGSPVGGWNPAERLTVAQALHLFTAGAAYANFEEGWRGALVPNQAADLMVLDRDPFAVDPSELKNLQVSMTIAGGRVAFER